MGMVRVFPNWLRLSPRPLGFEHPHSRLVIAALFLTALSKRKSNLRRAPLTVRLLLA